MVKRSNKQQPMKFKKLEAEKLRPAGYEVKFLIYFN